MASGLVKVIVLFNVLETLACIVADVGASLMLTMRTTLLGSAWLVFLAIIDIAAAAITTFQRFLSLDLHC